MFTYSAIIRATVLSVALGMTAQAFADVSPVVTTIKAFGKSYSPVASVPGSQAQVVYYRPAGAGETGSAHVYVDSEFHTGLLPGGYTAFCVSPGQHTLGAYLNDAPQYQGKAKGKYPIQLEGGKTYFLKVNEAANSAPQPLVRASAERELSGTHEQIHALSRASSVKACDYQASGSKDYALAGDVLFATGKSSYRDISPAGRRAIQELSTQLRNDGSVRAQIQVIGHTDPTGSASLNHALGLKRAQSVRRLLIEGGIPASSLHASSAGSSEPVASGCASVRTRSAKAACYAPDRRVVVSVKNQ